MYRLFCIISAILFLNGCVSTENSAKTQATVEVEKQQAICRSTDFKTKLERAKCLNAAVKNTVYIYYDNKDLIEQSMAFREFLAAKVDRKELTEEAAALQLAQANSAIQEQISSRASQRQAIIYQENSNKLAQLRIYNEMMPKQIPTPTYQAPVSKPILTRPPVHCTSIPNGQFVYTNCY